jgi:hypothetical protein
MATALKVEVDIACENYNKMISVVQTGQRDPTAAILSASASIRSTSLTVTESLLKEIGLLGFEIAAVVTKFYSDVNDYRLNPVYEGVKELKEVEIAEKLKEVKITEIRQLVVSTLARLAGNAKATSEKLEEFLREGEKPIILG